MRTVGRGRIVLLHESNPVMLLGPKHERQLRAIKTLVGNRS
jgi:hypothetical protein